MHPKTSVRDGMRGYDIDYTAIRCSAARALYTDIPYAKEIYEEIYPEYVSGRERFGIISDLVLKFSAKSGALCVLEGRYYATNETIKKTMEEGIPLLEIASGLSSRGLDISSRYSVYIETDKEATIKIKKKITESVLAKKNKKIPENHVFQELDIFNYEDFEIAGERLRKIDLYNPLAVIHEGLFMYFDNEQQEQARDNIKRFLEEYGQGGAWITPDFSYKKDKTTRPLARMLQFVIRKRLERFSGSSITYFDDEGVKKLLSDAGLKYKIFRNKHIAQKLSCIDKAGIDVEASLRFEDKYRTWFITIDDG